MPRSDRLCIGLSSSTSVSKRFTRVLQFVYDGKYSLRLVLRLSQCPVSYSGAFSRQLVV